MSPSSEIHLHPLDLAILLGYFATLIAVGVYHSRRQKDLDEYFLAGRDIRWLAFGLSLMAALNSGLDYLMQPGAMIKFGVYTMVGNLTWLILCPYVFYITLPLYRRLGVVSAYEYLERRFDVRVRTLAAAIFVLWRMGWMAMALYVPSLAIHVATGGAVSTNAMVVAIGLIIICYTMLGGMRAVIWNDVIQCWIMFAGLAATIGICIAHVDGGIGTILHQFNQVGLEAQVQPPAGAPGEPWTYFFIPMSLVGFFISILLSRVTAYTCDQVMVQRCQTSRTIGDARRGVLLTAVSDTVWMLSLSFVGLALFAFFNASTAGLPEWAYDQPDRVFPYFIARVFPAGLTGLVIAAILAASVSSIDSAVSSLTTVITVDFIKHLFLKRTAPISQNDPLEQRKLVRLSQVVTLFVGLIGIGLGVNVGRLGSLLEINNKIVISFTGPMLGIFMLGMFTRRATGWGALAGGAVGTLVTLFIAFQREIYQASNLWLHTQWNTDVVVSFLWPATFGFAATMVVGYSISLLSRAPVGHVGHHWTWSHVMQSELQN